MNRIPYCIPPSAYSTRRLLTFRVAPLPAQLESTEEGQGLSPFAWHTLYNIGDGNIVSRPTLGVALLPAQLESTKEGQVKRTLRIYKRISCKGQVSSCSPSASPRCLQMSGFRIAFPGSFSANRFALPMSALFLTRVDDHSYSLLVACAARIYGRGTGGDAQVRRRVQGDPALRAAALRGVVRQRQCALQTPTRVNP